MSEFFDIRQNTSSASAAPEPVPEPAAPAPELAPAPDTPTRTRRRVLIALAILLFLFVAAALWLFALHPDPDLERNIVVGSVDGDDAPVRDVAESMIAFSIDTKMDFATPSSAGDIFFENPEGNGKYIRLSLVRDEDDEELYSTGLLQPGTYVESDTLDAMVPTGTYECTALISAYRINDKSYIGTVAAGVTVSVGK